MKRTYVFCDFETTGLFDLRTNNEYVYPIEVGLIFTDENFVIYDMYDSLIIWGSLEDYIEKYNKWPQWANSAYKIHKIEPEEYLKNGIDKDDVAVKVVELCQKYKRGKYNPVLISDNIQFEFKLMEILLKDYCTIKETSWPFHYCGYDSSEILIRTGVGDPKPEHRALRDAALLHHHMIRSVERINGF